MSADVSEALSDREQEELARDTARVLGAMAPPSVVRAPYPMAFSALVWVAGELMRRLTCDAPEAEQATLVRELARSIGASAEEMALKLAKEERL